MWLFMMERIDYEEDILVLSFENERPVFGLDVHSTESLLAFGNDNHIIKVFDYEQNESLQSLFGHSRTIQTVQFHQNTTFPWILSASNDHTVRIWDFNNSGCILVLSEHTDCVVSALFHPSIDHLLVSASSDKSVRVWDISKVIKNLSSKQTMQASFPLDCCQPDDGDDYDVVIGNVSSRYILEGHKGEVSWAVFHPTLPFILSAGEDQELMHWTIYESMNVWKVNALRSHGSAVTQCAFDVVNNIAISIGNESIRLLDLSTRYEIKSFNKEGIMRFTSLTAHPTHSIFAVGHNSGVLVLQINTNEESIEG